MHIKYIPIMLAALALTLNACGKKEVAPAPQPIPAPTAPVPPPVMAGVTVGTISLGNAISASKKEIGRAHV